MSLQSLAASALTRAVQFTKEKLGVDEGELTEYDRHFDLLSDRAGESHRCYRSFFNLFHLTLLD